MRVALFTPLCLALFCLPVLPAQATVYVIDPGHTRVGYAISHLGFSNFPGRFNAVNGTIEFNPDRIEKSNVDVTIDVKSVSMDHDVLDKKLLAKDFFNADKYPTITFKSFDTQKTGMDRGVVTGDLTFLGVTKPVTLKVKFNKKGWNSYMGTEMVGFSATGKIRRSDFGMKSYLPDIGDEVKLYIEVEAQKPKAQDPHATGMQQPAMGSTHR